MFKLLIIPVIALMATPQAKAVTLTTYNFGACITFYTDGRCAQWYSNQLPLLDANQTANAITDQENSIAALTAKIAELEARIKTLEHP